MKLPLPLIARLFAFLQRRFAIRKPNLVIGDPARPYLRRWYVLPRNRLFNVYLHHFLRSDDDRALHDHPWLFNASLLLSGSYREHTIAAGGVHTRVLRSVGAVKVRLGPAPHRLELLPLVGAAEVYAMHPWVDTITGRSGVHITDDRPCGHVWTLFLTGPIVRQWGFHCERAGWVRWEDFTDNGGTTIGKGCDQ